MRKRIIILSLQDAPEGYSMMDTTGEGYGRKFAIKHTRFA
jgi:hypothetical protein